MAINWEEIQARHDAISQELMAPSLDNSKRIVLQKEHSSLSAFLTAHATIKKLEGSVAQTKKAAAENSDAELAQLYQEELADLELQLATAQGELTDLMFPPDPQDNRSVFLEIRAGAGGQEAALFVADMLRMYTNYGLQKRWKVAPVSLSETDLGGYREIILHIEGKGVFGHLRHESGVHRVQRVPATETQGRVHTSTVTVAVLPEAEEVELNINPADLRIDVFRAGGAGGQHVNKTESAVRITHIPTGTVVSCQDDRSQHKNKATAMKVLKSRILAAQKEAHESEMSQKRKELVGSGDRAEKVRTYNFPQNRITDHQVDMTLKKLDMVMEGDLDELIQALI
jgi:peptide chain release factor 1